MPTSAAPANPSQTVPRRRQRKDVDDGGSARQPQRKKSKPSPTTDTNHDRHDLPNGDAEATNGRLVSDHPDHTSASAQQLDMPLRARPVNGHHRSKHIRSSGVAVLTENPNYSIEHLPSFPDELRKSQAEYRGISATWTSQALAITRDKAFVWDSSQHSTSPTYRKFDLTYPSQANEDIPFGSLVNSGSSETGLLVVAPVSGRVTFWENVENADALRLFEKRRNGMEGTIRGQGYGERVVALEEAGQAGFVLTMSSGRIAHLLLRDAQGRPSIHVRFLDPNLNTGGGLLSGFKNVFGTGSHLRDVAAVRTQPQQKNGKVGVVIANAQAQFHIWQLDWSGQASFGGQYDAHEQLEEALRREFSEREAVQQFAYAILDVAILDKSAGSRHSATTTGAGPLDLIVLTSIRSSERAEHAIVELSLDRERHTIGRITTLHSYAAPLGTSPSSRACIFLSVLQQTAFIVFENALTFVSVAHPSNELNGKSKKSTKHSRPWQETVYLRERSNLCFVGAGLESNDPRQTSSLSILRCYVRDYGILRVVVEEPEDIQEAVTRSPADAKNKLEQAVFNGTSDDNPLDLVRGSKTKFPPAQIEDAAIAISEEIVSSSSPYLQSSLSMEQHLEQRAKTLNNLALHLKHNYNPLSKRAEWELLWFAEKIAAAKSIWSSYEARAQKNKAEPRLLPEIVEYIHEDFKTEVDSTNGEGDQLRQWFLKDIVGLDTLIMWAYQGVYELAKLDEYADEQSRVPIISDANDIVISGLEAAWTFRSENAWLYNLDIGHKLVDGMTASGYENLPEFWTSRHPMAWKIRQLIVNGSANLSTINDRDNENEELAEQSPLVLKIAEDNPRLVKLCCKAYEERIGWLKANQEQRPNERAEDVRAELQAERTSMLTALPTLGMGDQGLALAEEYSDMRALVDIFTDETIYWNNLLSEMRAIEVKLERRDTDNDLEAAHRNVLMAKSHIRELDDRMRRYFKKFGSRWANALYSTHASKKLYTKILDASEYDWQAEEVQKYLNTTSRRQRLGWINEALASKDFAAAGRSLANVATEEQSLWSKRIELSLAKLSFSAADEGHQPSEHLHNADQLLSDAQALMSIQNKIADHVAPTLYGALDEDSELDILRQEFGRQKTYQRPSLQELLERGLDSLKNSSVMGPEQLIDVLTLMDHKQCEMLGRNIAGQEFVLALQVLQHSGFEPASDRYQTLLKIIWRRCFIDDQWEKVNDTSRKSDGAVAAALENTTLFGTLLEGTKSSLFGGATAIPILSLDEVRGAGGSPEDYIDRFPSEDLRIPIAQDTAKEDDVLEEYVARQRLVHWIDMTKDWANRCLQNEKDAKTNNDKQVHEAANIQRAREKRKTNR